MWSVCVASKDPSSNAQDALVRINNIQCWFGNIHTTLISTSVNTNHSGPYLRSLEAESVISKHHVVRRECSYQCASASASASNRRRHPVTGPTLGSEPVDICLECFPLSEQSHMVASVHSHPNTAFHKAQRDAVVERLSDFGGCDQTGERREPDQRQRNHGQGMCGLASVSLQ